MADEVTFRAYSVNDDADASIDVTKPTGTVDDDVMVALVFGSAAAAPTFTAPDGWTEIATQTIPASGVERISIYYKVADTEGASYTWAHDGGAGSKIACVIATYYNVLTSDPVDTFSNTRYNTSDTTLRAATLTPSAQPVMLVFAGWGGPYGAAFTPPANFTERADCNLTDALNDLTIADRYYESTDATGNVDGTLASTVGNYKHAFLVALNNKEFVTPAVPVITEPDAADAFRDSVAVEFTCSSTDPNSDPVYFDWEIDTADPPVSTNADYITLSSGYVASAASASVYNTFARTDRGTWYCRARASDGTYTSAWSATVAFSIIEGVRILPGASISTSTLEVANKVYVVVDKSSPLVQEDATNDVTAPTYSLSPRETLVIIKAGDATAAQAVADATLALRKVKRTNLSGIPVPLRYGLGIQRGQKVNVTIPRASITGTYAVRRVEHDFGSNVSVIDVGEFNRPRDQEDALVSLAKTLAKIEKESALA